RALRTARFAGPLAGAVRHRVEDARDEEKHGVDRHGDAKHQANFCDGRHAAPCNSQVAETAKRTEYTADQPADQERGQRQDHEEVLPPAKALHIVEEPSLGRRHGLRRLHRIARGRWRRLTHLLWDDTLTRALRT